MMALNSLLHGPTMSYLPYLMLACVASGGALVLFGTSKRHTQLAVLLVAMGMLIYVFFPEPNKLKIPQPRLPVIESSWQGHNLTLEVASTPNERTIGLMERTHLPPFHGMLFVWPEASPRRFWMKRTLVPLDILFFDAQGRLQGMALSAKPCTADPCPEYTGNYTGPSQWVLELPAEEAEQLGVHPGLLMPQSWKALSEQALP